MKQKIIQNIKVIVICLIIAAGVSYASAGTWSTPSSSIVNGTPNGNVDAPLNVGTSTQSKLGGLLVNTSLTNPATTGLSVWGNSVFNGGVQISTGASAGSVLTSDANGNATWQNSIPSTIKVFDPVNDSYGNPKTQTWTPPAGVTKVRVRVWGAGGGGGKGSSGQAGGGGGAGGYAESIVSVNSNTTYTIQVGIFGYGGGMAGCPGAGGYGAYGCSYFSSTPSYTNAIVSANTGTQGGDAPSGTSSFGGTASGTIAITGGSGDSAGYSGRGGDSPSGGLGGAGGNVVSSGFPWYSYGYNGNVPGGGGGGGYGKNSNGSLSPGGYGANGRVIIEY